MTSKSKRSIPSDLRWGMREGLIRTGIMLVPASMVALWGTEVDWRQFATIVASYLAFGAIAGAFAGLMRPQLSTWPGAMLVGAVVGAAGTLLLVATNSRVGTWQPGLLVFTAVVGAVIGASAATLLKSRRSRRL